MIGKVVKIFKERELRNKILFVLGVLFVFRVLANIPIPGVDKEQLTFLFSQFQLLGLFSAFTGGTLDTVSIAMLGLGPYITASVILQLLALVIPSLEKMYKEGTEIERQRFNQYGRVLTVPISILQSFGMLTLLERSGVISSLPFTEKIVAMVVITTGTMILMWLGELIQEYGIGNGISILIMAGILAALPSQILGLIQQIRVSERFLINYALFLALALFIIFAVVIITLARRNIPIVYAKRVRGRRIYGGGRTFLPVSVNPAGVMPIIFAISLLTLPGMVLSFLSLANFSLAQQITKIALWLQSPLVYNSIYFWLVFGFTFFYTMAVFDPKAIAKDLQRVGAFVPGIRPGEATQRYISYVLYRILPLGALFLGIIALSPFIVSSLTKVTGFSFLVGGTSLLILVSVILDLWRELEAQLQLREL